MRHFRNVNAYQRYLVSIHASVKDATQLRAFKAGLYLVSIHASVKDATKINAGDVVRVLFQSTHL